MSLLVAFTVEKLNGVSAAAIEFDRRRELAKRTEMFNLLKKCLVIFIVSFNAQSCSFPQVLIVFEILSTKEKECSFQKIKLQQFLLFVKCEIQS